MKWVEKRFGLTKTFNHSITKEDILKASDDLAKILLSYKQELGIPGLIPKIDTAVIDDNTVHFMFFDKNSTRRIFLGDWLDNKKGS